MALAAVVGQERDQLIHRAVVGRVVNETAFPPSSNQPDPGQVGEVERQRRRRKALTIPDGARIDAFRPRFDEQAKNGQTRFVAQGGKEFGST